MGASASMMAQAPAELQAEIQAEYEKLKGEGLGEEEIETKMKEKYAEQIAAAAAAPAEGEAAAAAAAPAEGETAAVPAEGEAAAAAPADAAATDATPKAIKKIIIAGAPASGKGTQCESIRETYGCVHLSTGDMLRAAVTAGSELGLEAKKVMDEGGLVADETMIGIITSRLAEADCVEKGWLLDGFPRTGAQAEGLKAANIECDKFIYLEVPDDVLLARVTGRRLDPVTGTIYHTEFKPAPDEEVAGRLEQRSDDTEEKLKPRLEAFHTNLESILGSYTDKMFKTDGNRDPKVVWEEIKAELDK